MGLRVRQNARKKPTEIVEMVSRYTGNEFSRDEE